MSPARHKVSILKGSLAQENLEDSGIMGLVAKESCIDSLNADDLIKLESMIKAKFIDQQVMQASIITQNTMIYSNKNTTVKHTNVKNLELLKYMLRCVVKFKLIEDELEKEDHKALNLKQTNLKEMHKVLSRWNKPVIKQFLRNSSLFNASNFETLTLERRDSSVLERQSSTFSHTTEFMGNLSTNSNANVQKLSISDMKMGGFMQPNKKEDRTKPVIDETTREVLKIGRKENSDELLSLAFNLTKPSETYSNMFKIGLENNPKFPKSIEEVPLMAIPFITGKETFYEEKSAFGGLLESNASTKGYEHVIEETLRMVIGNDGHFICSNGLNRDSDLEKIVKGLRENKFVYLDEYEGETEVYCFSDEGVKALLKSCVPDHYYESNLLLYYIYIMTMRFGKAWMWTEKCLTSLPSVRGYV